MNDTIRHTHDFRLVSYPVRVYSGKDALESLPSEISARRSACGVRSNGIESRSLQRSLHAQG